MQLAIFTVLPQFMSESLNIWVAGILIKLQKYDMRIYGNPLHFPPVGFRPHPHFSVQELIKFPGLPHSSFHPSSYLSF